MPETSLKERFANGEVIILDGGMGAELRRRGLEWRHRDLWATNALLFEPDTVRVLHEDYIRAGAEVITVNSYGAHRHNLEREGLGDRTVQLNRLSVELALQARDNVGACHKVWVAGSISHLREFDHEAPGSGPAALTIFREQAEALAEGGVDLIIVEIIPNVIDARYAAEAAAATGLTTWVAISCGTDGRARSGETMAEVVKAVEPFGVSAIIIFHTPVDDSTIALKELIGSYLGVTGVYVESGGLTRYEEHFENVISTPDYLKHCEEWVEMGAQIIGGCCGIGPEHIEVLSANLPRRASGPGPR